MAGPHARKRRKREASAYPCRTVISTVELADGAHDVLDCGHLWHYPGGELPPAVRYHTKWRRCRACGPVRRPDK